MASIKDEPFWAKAAREQIEGSTLKPQERQRLLQGMEGTRLPVHEVDGGTWLISRGDADTLHLRVNVGRSAEGYHFRVEVDGWSDQPGPWNREAFGTIREARWAGNAEADRLLTPDETELLCDKLTVIEVTEWQPTAEPGYETRVCVAEGRYGYHYAVEQRQGEGAPERLYSGQVRGDQHDALRIGKTVEDDLHGVLAEREAPGGKEIDR